MEEGLRRWRAVRRGLLAGKRSVASPVALACKASPGPRYSIRYLRVCASGDDNGGRAMQRPSVAPSPRWTRFTPLPPACTRATRYNYRGTDIVSGEQLEMRATLIILWRL